MRVVIVGGSNSLAVAAATTLLERGHEVIVVEHDAEVVEDLKERLDCGLIHGDGGRPHVLEEAGPEQTDFLLCLSESDETNVLGALVGRSLGFAHVVPRLEDPELETVCTELGLDSVIVPDRAGALRVADLVEGRDSPEVSAVLRAGLRFLSIVVPEGKDDLGALDLPDDVRAVAYTRGEESFFVGDDTRLEEGDQIVLLASEELAAEVRERFG